MKEEATISAALDEGNEGRTDTHSSEIDGLAAEAITRDEATNRRGRQALARLIRAHGGKVQDGRKSARPAQTQNSQASRASTVHALGGDGGTDRGKG